MSASTIRADERVLEDGYDVCSHCNEISEEGDLYYIGRDGDAWCELCIVGCSDRWRKAKLLMRQAAAALKTRGFPAMDSLANEIENLIDGV